MRTGENSQRSFREKVAGPASRAMAFVAAPVVAMALSACSSPIPSDPPMAATTGEAQLSCGAQRAAWAIGERDSPTVRARLMADTGASELRLLDDQNMTGFAQHTPTRLNIRVGPNNTVRRVSCG
jgi:hypothetical protein